jgi:hypothetical protein
MKDRKKIKLHTPYLFTLPKQKHKSRIAKENLLQ